MTVPNIIDRRATLSFQPFHNRYFPPSRPIDTDEGIKARSQRGQFGKNWWATRWISALERLLDSGRLGWERSYARKGQVLSIKEKLGGVTAKVQGSICRPYTVTIDLPT